MIWSHLIANRIHTQVELHLNDPIEWSQLNVYFISTEKTTKFIPLWLLGLKVNVGKP